MTRTPFAGRLDWTPNRRRAVAAIGGLLAIACAFALALSRPAGPAVAGPAGGVDLSHLSIGVSEFATGFTNPDCIVNAGDGSGRLFVAEQSGLIRVIRGGVVQPQPYLDLRPRVYFQGERGVEGMVFSPRFRKTGRLYVFYSAGPMLDVIERITVNRPASDTPRIVRRTVILKLQRTDTAHHGGAMAFGPDGYLYVGIGDGGPQGDPHKHAQNNKILFGKILRIDPGDRPGKKLYNGTYHIPTNNPFYKKKGYRKEIWATGLRNPFRFSFDSATGDLWIADVGQDLYEEVDFQRAGSKGGQNYGWNVWEGNHRYRPTPYTPLRGAPTKPYTFPILEYPHPIGECIIGGYVYRGHASPALYGTYLYGDWVDGWIGAIRRTTPGGAVLSVPETATVATTTAMITTWGTDEAGEPYFSDWKTGSIFSVTASSTP